MIEYVDYLDNQIKEMDERLSEEEIEELEKQEHMKAEAISDEERGH